MRCIVGDAGASDMNVALPIAVFGIAAVAAVIWLWPPATEWFLGAIRDVGGFLGTTVAK